MFAITAFGPFQGVEANPSDALARWLASAADIGDKDVSGSGGGAANADAGMSSVPPDCVVYRGCDQPARLRLPGGGSAVLLACDTLAVSARAADAWIAAALPRLCRTCGSSRLVLLHLGVAPNASVIRLEARAADSADFRCADADGWRAQRVAISAVALCQHAWGSSAGGCGELSASAPEPRWRATSIDVAGLAARLTAAGHEVSVSDDAGRFICNWIFYRSLEAAAAGSGDERGGGVASLFVHVPPFSAVPEQRQRAFLLGLLSALSDGGSGGGANV